MTFFERLKRKLRPYKYRFKQGEARIGRLEKQVESLQEQLRDLMETTTPFTGEFREMMAPLVPHLGATRKVRVGNTEDGAYVMIDDFGGIEQALSLGVGKEVAWDLAIAGKGIPVLQFDPSIAGPSINHPLFQFHRKALVGVISDPAREVLLSSVIPAGQGANLLLKMDIEGAEWEVLDATKTEELARFRQVVIEFHDLDRYRQPQWRARARRVFEKLAATHRLVHVHGNNFNTTFAGGSRECPRDLEMTFALASHYELSPSGEHFPGPLDRPNKAGMPDYKLGSFRF
jgi:methyltransferase FkbM-like protein